MTLRALLEAARPVNAAMSLVAVVIGGLVVPSFSLSAAPDLALAGVVAALVAAGGNVVNDVFDLKIDRVNRPDRPIPSGRLPLPAAKAASVLLLGSALLGALVNAVVLGVAAFNAALLALYSYRLKGVPLAGNLSIAYLVGSTFLFGGAAVGGPVEAVPLFLLASLATLGREVAKDVEDRPGDLGHADTLATELGVRAASWAAAAPLLLAALVSPLPFLLDVLGLLYLPFAAAADAALLYATATLIRSPSVEAAARSQRWIKIGMLAALAGFFAGAL